MGPSRASGTALLRPLRSLAIASPPPLHPATALVAVRSFSTGSCVNQELETSNGSSPPPENPLLSSSKPEDLILGPRRRRLAVQQTSAIPFNQLPYQCFQEARSILIADRAEKLQQIEKERTRIERLKATDAADVRGGEPAKEARLRSMSDYLEKLKVWADINDPNVKRRFEDGKGVFVSATGGENALLLTISAGDMNKPVYRHLAEKKWESYRRKIQVQRLTTMRVVPDVVPNCDLVVDISLRFGRHTYAPGEFVASDISEQPPRLRVQSFARGERVFSIAVVDPDVPNLSTDSFDSRCHFLATNVTISPTSPLVNLATLAPEQVLMPWLPPTAQKGSPYHRLAIVLLQHRDNVPIDNSHAAQKLQPRIGFSTRKFMHNHMLTPIGATLFRVKWDDTMAEVMGRHNIEGADLELKRIKVEPLPYQRRNPASFR
ncbi:hypothetical protein DV735_g2396, partial [Chaetothyriales sp. CBS 134920]